MFNNFFKDSSFSDTEESFEKIRNIINTAFRLGINYFDVAPWYDNAQRRLAVGLKGHERSKYYLATKVGRYNSDKNPTEWFDFSYKRTIESVEESLKIFETDYIDLIQVKLMIKFILKKHITINVKFRFMILNLPRI